MKMPYLSFTCRIPFGARPGNGEMVVLIHGLGLRGVCMIPLAGKLVSQGYACAIHDYPSTRFGIDRHVEELSKSLGRMLESCPEVKRIHMVGHSLGGIIALRTMQRLDRRVRGRLVLIGTPVQGSSVADFFMNVPLVPLMLRPLRELGSGRCAEKVPKDGPDRIEAGVIAGLFDRKARVGETHIEGVSGRLIVPGFHTFLMIRRDSMDGVCDFINHGSFNPNPILKAIRNYDGDVGLLHIAASPDQSSTL